MEGGLANNMQTAQSAIAKSSRPGQGARATKPHQKPALQVASVSRHSRPAEAASTLPARGLYSLVGKRLFDVAFSATFLLLVGSWLFPLIALAIRLDSSGPVFYRQPRVGRNGKIFKCLKFRTMVNDPQASFVQATKNDPRITRVGAWLRRTNLDEVPQFINSLMGSMSIVGPRPHVPELGQLFESRVAGYAVRNLVRPGITGLAQISGCRGETRSVRDMTHRVRFDGFYVRNMSFLLDLTIIMGTVWAVFRGDENAY